MTQMSIEEAMRLAVGHHQGGRWAEAEGIYRQILAQVPDHADALHLLGALACQMGHTDVAIDLICRAIERNSAVADYHSNLGESYRRAGCLEAAFASLSRAIELRPEFADAQANLGITLMELDRAEEAIAAFHRAIVLKPDHAETHTNLGNALWRAGRLDEAIVAFRRAVTLRPDLAEAHYNLGNALKRTGCLDEAIDAYHRAIRFKPEYAEAHSNLASALQQQSRIDEAIDAYHCAIAIRPDDARAHNSLGDALWSAKRLDEAILAYRRSIALRPDDAEAHNSLGNAFSGRGRLDEAIHSYRSAIALRPDYAEAYSNLGITLKEASRMDEAIAAYRRAIECGPDNAESHNNLGVALTETGQLDEAMAALSRAIQLKPGAAEAHCNMGLVFKDQGRLDEALVSFRTALALNPDLPTAASNVLCALHYHPGYDAPAILAEHRAWARRFADPLSAQVRRHANDREPARRLRIGFVSPDFRAHPVGRSLLPLFSHLDRRQFEVVCYSDVKWADDVTGQLRALTDEWLDIAGLDDPLVAERIRDDRIDLLVDLALHTAGNRMPVFARKPAPVQVTMLGLPSTTGLAAIDYRLTDAYLDPPGAGDENYAERSVRLPHSFWCYHPPALTPPVGPLPAMENGFVTFGCLNNFSKVTLPAVQLWMRILQAVPASRLIIHSRTGGHRDAVRTLFANGGIAPERVEFAPSVSMARYFALHDRLDIGLDPFPFNGGISTMDALWMGVPVVTLSGCTAVGRGGVSTLSNVGLPELIAAEPQRYLEIAVAWANDVPRLAQLRAGLRERLRDSALMDGAGYAADVGSAFRRMWEAWCER